MIIKDAQNKELFSGQVNAFSPSFISFLKELNLPESVTAYDTPQSLCVPSRYNVGIRTLIDDSVQFSTPIYRFWGEGIDPYFTISSNSTAGILTEVQSLSELKKIPTVCQIIYPNESYLSIDFMELFIMNFLGYAGIVITPSEVIALVRTQDSVSRLGRLDAQSVHHLLINNSTNLPHSVKRLGISIYSSNVDQLLCTGTMVKAS